MPSDQHWAEWCETFDDALHQSHTLLHTRWMWRAITSLMVNGNPDGVDQSLALYFERTYVMTACIGIRREGDADARTSSLARCLATLRKTPAIATRRQFADAAREHMEASQQDVDEVMIDAAFDRFAPDGGQHLDRGIPTRWAKDLRRDLRPIKDFVDKVLAHRDRIAPEDITPSWLAVNLAMDSIAETLMLLYGLRHPMQQLAQVTPHPDLGFVQMFRRPWYSMDWKPPELPKV